MDMTALAVAAAWAAFMIYLIWYFAKAKHYAPLSMEEAQLLWKIHKARDDCNSKTWSEIHRGGKMVGFRCGCGYKHIQKRPVKAPKTTSTMSFTTLYQVQEGPRQ